jgi:uncharacterized protein (TIGR03790 family)
MLRILAQMNSVLHGEITSRAVAGRAGHAVKAARHRLVCLSARSSAIAIAWFAIAAAAAGQPAAPGAEAASRSPGSAAAPMPEVASTGWMTVPRIAGRLGAKDIGLVINTDDPYSVAVGDHYIKARRLAPSQVLRIALPVKPVLTPHEFDRLSSAIASHFGSGTQALALAWVLPFAVGCNGITGALALGYDPGLCDRGCGVSRRSPYFNSASLRPSTDLKMRLSMLLAAPGVESAKALIDRGVRADGSLGLRGAPPVQAYFLSTDDRARNVRAALFPPAGMLRRVGVDVHVEHAPVVRGAKRVLLYETGLPTVQALDTLTWVPGALADHLTSYGGQLTGGSGQMSVLDWIASGATASYGTVSEPCAHQQKFPHPQLLLLHYLQGATAIEAYWRSVAWPQQGVFVGEPLAAPFARR